MRLGVISDIHGNALALEAVLRDLGRQGVDAVLNLGDHLSGPLEPRRTCDLLMGHTSVAIRGNHDRQLVTTPAEQMGASDRHAAFQLETAHRAWLKALPSTIVFENEVFLCHGTPQSDQAYWLEQISETGGTCLAERHAIEQSGSGLDYPVLLCGHTHIPRSIRLADGRLVVNPGSVGCPAYQDDEPTTHVVQTGSTLASYAILDRQARAWSVTFRQVPYDNLAMAALAEQNGRSEWAQALRTGWLR
jgi:putative phosphoesterase